MLALKWAVTGLLFTQVAYANKVKSFSPQGDAKEVRQVQARFTQDMVPMGDPRGAIPFDIACLEKGTARWVDSKNWVYEFTRALPAGIECSFALKKGLTTLAGVPLADNRVFKFSTGGPHILSTTPSVYSAPVEDQIFVVRLDAPVSPTEVETKAVFKVEGLATPVGIKVLQGADAEPILKATYVGKDEEPTTLVLQPKTVFAPGARISLVWDKSIRTLSGIANKTDQVFNWAVRTPFQTTFECTRENADADCVPFVSLTLRFSANVLYKQAAQITLKGPNGKVYQASEGEYRAERISVPTGKKPVEIKEVPASDAFVTSIDFDGPFPANTEFTISVPPGLTDDTGRPLSNASRFPLKVRTAGYSPLAKFAGNFSIVEWNGDGVVPVTLRQVEAKVAARLRKAGESTPLDPIISAGLKGKKGKIEPSRLHEILYWLKRIERADREKSVFGASPDLADTPEALKPSVFELPTRKNPEQMEVVGIPFKEPGFYVLELESPKLGAALLDTDAPMYVPTGVLVTNMGVHFKWAAEKSAVWVTELSSGKPVSGAKVQVLNCKGESVGSAASDADGIAWISGVPAKENLPDCTAKGRYDYSEYNRGLLITAQAGKDLSFLHSSSQQGIESWRFDVAWDSTEAPFIVHSVLDRSLLRAGETLHAKHFIRKSKELGMVKEDDLPPTATIVHEGTQQKYSFPLKWKNGAAETEWKIPRQVRLGKYDIKYEFPPKNKKAGESENSKWAGQFRVDEFRIPVMKAVLQGPKEKLIRRSSFPVNLSVTYLSGGGVSKLPVRFRYQPSVVASQSYEDFEGYTFSSGPVKEMSGRRTESDENSPPAQKQSVVDLVLDKTGAQTSQVSGLQVDDRPVVVKGEFEYPDANGEIQTVSQDYTVYPSENLVGIKVASNQSRESVIAETAVVDPSGKPIADAEVTVTAYQEKTYSHRKRLVGGYYAYEHFKDVKRLGPICVGKTRTTGKFTCVGKAPIAGWLILVASTKDARGNLNSTQNSVWASGGGTDFWSQVEDHDRMDLIPEKRRLEPGEIAKIQVRMPFREATALIGIEQNGIQELLVKRISGQNPILELPMKGSYAPNVFISVLAVRGRVGSPAPTATVDLGRPAFKLGLTSVKVGWKEHELKVAVKTDREVYQVREKASATVKVTLPNGSPAAGSEIALAAVDEGLLELYSNSSWDLLTAMMALRPYNVENSTNQMNVIGKRHYGVKAVPVGGDGGAGGGGATRELFDTLLLWKGRVQIGSDGTAKIEIPLNDSITSFRIVAIASLGNDLFGTGSSTIRSNQDLMVLPGVPLVAREGDEMKALATVRNTTNQPLEAELVLSQNGDAQKGKVVVLAPGESREIAWDVKVPVGVSSQIYEFQAAAKGGKRDRVKITQLVKPAIPTRVLQSTIVQVENSTSIPVQAPKESVSGSGGVTLTLSPKLASNLQGVRTYMKEYPFSCMEQEVSRVISLRDREGWERIQNSLPSYQDSSGLIKYFPSQEEGSDVLTAYVLAIAHEAKWKLPADVQTRMINGLNSLLENEAHYAQRANGRFYLERRLSAMAAVARYGNPLQIRNERVTDPAPATWPTSVVYDWITVLENKYAYPRREELLKEAYGVLRSRTELQGTTLGLRTVNGDRNSFLMASPDSNAVRLLATTVAQTDWKDDAPRLARGVLALQRQGHWDLTTANAWGVLALEKFSTQFESVPVAGSSQAAVADQSQKVNWQGDKPPVIQPFRWPAGQADVSFTHSGTGKPWLTVQTSAALKLTEPLSAGFGVTKTIEPLEQKVSGKWSRGDMARIKIKVNSPMRDSWVVVLDPIPTGAAILGTGLGRDSALATQGEKTEGWVWPVFKERAMDSYRAYYDEVPQGDFSVEYTIRLNNEGKFSLPPTRVEAMYSPERFAESPNPNWEITP